MDKIQKISKWIWLNKERMILVVMFGVLGFRVYRMLYPLPTEEQAVLRAPRPQIPDSEQPPTPPMAPPMTPPGTYASLFRQNPFWFYSRESTGTDKNAPVDFGIRLLSMRKVGERWRAQLTTKSLTKWYYEGDEFEQFVLESIDPEKKTVVIYSEQYAKRETLSLSQ